MGPILGDRSAKGWLRSLEGECWIDREIGGCEFRDARLGDRFRKLLTQIGSAMSKHRQAKGRFRDEDIARHDHERRASGIGPALVIA